MQPLLLLGRIQECCSNSRVARLYLYEECAQNIILLIQQYENKSFSLKNLSGFIVRFIEIWIWIMKRLYLTSDNKAYIRNYAKIYTSVSLLDKSV